MKNAEPLAESLNMEIPALRQARRLRYTGYQVMATPPHPLPEHPSLLRLIRQLQLAYSGELAAGYAYRGHWRSASNPEERESIARIEQEEWHHRTLVGQMLRDLGSKPRPLRELCFLLIGRVLGALCHVSGWLAPMYGAGRLESRNIIEYEEAADYAIECGHPELVDCLLTMAEVEWDHELYFRQRVLSHRWSKSLPLWDEPAPRRAIRERRQTGTTAERAAPLLRDAR